MKEHYNLKKPLRVAVYARIGSAPSAVTHYPAEQDLLADCRTGQVDYLLVESITRLGRNTMESWRITRDLNKAGVKVCLLNEGLVV